MLICIVLDGTRRVTGNRKQQVARRVSSANQITVPVVVKVVAARITTAVNVTVFPLTLFIFTNRSEFMLFYSPLDETWFQECGDEILQSEGMKTTTVKICEKNVRDEVTVKTIENRRR